MQNKSYICNFIKEHKDWKDIFSQRPYKINIKQENNLIILNYGIIQKCDFSLPEVQEARGIIIDLDTLDVVCWPFRKFGNVGESYIDDINWDTAKVQEKIDGSIMKLWYYGDKWHLSSNSIITLDEDNLFVKNFTHAAKRQNLDLNKLNKDCTYMFELTGPENQIVLPYDDTEIWHIGTRNNKTGEELQENIGIQKPAEYPLHTLNDCIEASKKLNVKGMEHEGFVVVDDSWHRLKVKSPEYVIAAHLQSLNRTLSNFVELIRSGEEDEYLSYFPDDKDEVERTRLAIDNLKEFIEKKQSDFITFYKTLSYDRKQFALAIKDDPYRSWAFRTLDGTEAEKILDGMSSKKVAELIKAENLMPEIEESELAECPER